jgi:hypothetical protein
MEKPYKLLLLSCIGGIDMKYAIAFLLVFLVACSQGTEKTTPTAPAPVAQAEEPTMPQQAEQPTTDEGAQAIVSGSDKAFGTVNTTSVLKIDDVKCDREQRSITFRFENNDAKNWQMNQQVGWGDTSVAPVRIFVNGYEANGKVYMQNGERYFGPKELFSDNCGGIEVLKPGNDVTCTIYPVPLKTATALSSGANEIFIDSPTSHHKIQFTC